MPFPDLVSIMNELSHIHVPGTEPGQPRSRGSTWGGENALDSDAQARLMAEAVANGTLDQWIAEHNASLTDEDITRIGQLLASLQAQDASDPNVAKGWTDLEGFAGGRGYVVANEAAASLADAYSKIKAFRETNNLPFVDMKAFEDANKDHASGPIEAGTVFKVPGSLTQPRSVVAGENGIPNTAEGIATHFGMPVDVIVKGNGLTSPTQDITGVKVLLPDEPGRSEQARVSPEQNPNTPSAPYTQRDATVGNPSGEPVPGNYPATTGTTTADGQVGTPQTEQDKLALALQQLSGDDPSVFLAQILGGQKMDPAERARILGNADYYRLAQTLGLASGHLAPPTNELQGYQDIYQNAPNSSSLLDMISSMGANPGAADSTQSAYLSDPNSVMKDVQDLLVQSMGPRLTSRFFGSDQIAQLLAQLAQQQTAGDTGNVVTLLHQAGIL